MSRIGADHLAREAIVYVRQSTIDQVINNVESRLSLAPGPYRFRTVEAGAEVDREIGADGVIPTLVARGGDILLEGASGRDELVIRNESDRPLVFVVEDRNWARDALTGENPHFHVGASCTGPCAAGSPTKRQRWGFMSILPRRRTWPQSSARSSRARRDRMTSPSN